MSVYYNEHDSFAAAWLCELIAGGFIPAGEVDTRDIRDVCPSDLTGYVQCHFFAGIGGWAYALRLAGWPDDAPVWTGSCPCQPFSQAGKGGGFDDERHLWPDWHWLIEQSSPVLVFGEQVASSDGLVWLDLVSSDLEATGYAVAASDLCSASVKAFDIRQRLWWMAHSERRSSERHRYEVAGKTGRSQGSAQERQRFWVDAGYGGISGELAHAESQRGQRLSTEGRTEVPDGDRSSEVGGMALAGCQSARRGVQKPSKSSCATPEWTSGKSRGPGGAGFWDAHDWLHCADDTWRAVEPGTFPLAHGIPARVGRLRGYGNAINPHVAAAFIQAAAEVLVWEREGAQAR